MERIVLNQENYTVKEIYQDFYIDNNNDYNACSYNTFTKKKKLGMFLYRR